LQDRKRLKKKAAYWYVTIIVHQGPTGWHTHRRVSPYEINLQQAEDYNKGNEINIPKFSAKKLFKRFLEDNSWVEI